MSGGWDPLETMDQFDVELVMVEDPVAQTVRRGRLQTFNTWAHRNGIGGPQDITVEAWLQFAAWMETDQNYAPAYRKHVIMEIREWLAWAAERNLCAPIELGHPIPQASIENLCLAHQSGGLQPTRAFGYHFREMMIGLVFGLGLNPDLMHKMVISDYDMRQHTLYGEPLDPRAEKVIQRYLGPRMRRPKKARQMLVDLNGQPLQPGAVRSRLNELLRPFGGLPPVDRNQATLKWMPTPHRDRELVLNILMSRPALQPRGGHGHAFDAGLVIRGLLGTRVNLPKREAVVPDTELVEGNRMALKMREIHVCDRCGEDGFPVVLSWTAGGDRLGRGEVSIDLCEVHLAEVVGTPAPAQQSSVKSNGSTKKKALAPAAETKTSISAEVREWAHDNGVQVPRRGKVPADVIEQYQSATRGRTLAAASA